MQQRNQGGPEWLLPSLLEHEIKQLGVIWACCVFEKAAAKELRIAQHHVGIIGEVKIHHDVELVADVRSCRTSCVATNGNTASVVKSIVAFVEPEVVILQPECYPIARIEIQMGVEIVDILAADLVCPAEIVMPERVEMIECVRVACTRIRVAARIVIANPGCRRPTCLAEVSTEAGSVRSGK